MLFLFDMDNVLYHYDWRARMHGLTALTGHDFHELRRRWWHDEGEWKAEAGIPATGEEYLRAVNQALDSSLDRDTWLANRREAMTPLPDILALATTAKEFGDVAVLTNNGALIGEHLSEIAHELTPIFGDKVYATATFQARKPDGLVFRRVLEHLGHSAESTFFLDDMPENVRGAESVGITARWFSPHDPPHTIWSAMQAFIDRQAASA